MVWTILAVAIPPAIRSVICGQPAFYAPFAVIKAAVNMEHFGKMKEDFLRTFLEPSQGIPCYHRARKDHAPANVAALSDASL